MAIEPVNMDGETWRDVPGTDGNYQVSNLGRARRIRILTPVAHDTGRLVITIHETDGQRKRIKLINRLVCEAFHGVPLEGFHAAHLNGDHTDNRAANLAWTTAKENNGHKVLHGTAQRGERHNQVVITDEAVKQIRSRPTMSRAEKDALAEKLGITRGHINDIIARKCWQHLP